MTTEITKILEGFKKFSENPAKDSIKFLRQYIEFEPSEEACFELGKALFLNGDYEESIRWLEKTGNVKAEAYLGLDHYSMKDYPNAIRHFQKFLEEKTNETVLAYLMLAYEKNGKWRNAVECGERLLEINPNNYSVKIRLIDYHFSLREYEMSLHYLNELDCKKLKYKKGNVLFGLKRYEEAINELKNIKSLEAYKLISKCYEKMGKPRKAIIYLTKAYEREQDIEILFEISEISLKNGFHINCISILERILIDDSKNERVLEKMARNYLELQKFEHAIACCEELLEINENNVNAYIILSETFPYFGDYDKIMEFVKRGLEIDPQCAELWKQKAWAHFPFDIDEFCRCFERAVKLEPNNIKNYKNLIRYCTFNDRKDKAKMYFEKLLLYHPEFTESFEEIIDFSYRY